MNSTRSFDLHNGDKWTYTLICSILLGLLLVYFQKDKKTVKQTKKDISLNKVDKEWKVTSVGEDFHHTTALPLRPFPFKNADYKLTMGIKNLDPQDWLLVENTYRERLAIKDKIIHDQHEDYAGMDMRKSTVFESPEAKPAIIEYYNLVVKYMVDKYPMHFIPHPSGIDGNSKTPTMFNNIIDREMPLKVDDSFDSQVILDLLSQTIEEDFIILLKDPSRSHEVDGEEYYFKAGLFAFAAGFNPKDRFDKPLSFIHHPIPGYESKMKMSMNRFFNRIAPGQFVTRGNFSVQTHAKFFVDDSNKGHNLPAGFEQRPLDAKDLDFVNDVHYRSERQVLTKLPETGAVIFTIKTYLIPMCEIKKESDEVRERFIGAINKFPEDIQLYKRAKEWAPPVTEYLSGVSV